jgi:ATP-binding cassette subfamily B multidrug efflux pump
MHDFLQTVYIRRCGYVTKLNRSARYLEQFAAAVSVGAIGISLWLAGSAAAVGAMAAAVGLVLRLEGMAHWIMWELAGLFENIGVAEDGKTIARPRAVSDKPDAEDAARSQGDRVPRMSASTTARRAA